MSEGAAGGTSGAGAAVTGAPQGAPGPVRAKISDMGKILSHGIPAAPTPLARQEQAPQAQPQRVEARVQADGFDRNGNPDLGFGGDLDGLDSGVDGKGAELDSDGFGTDLDLDDSTMGEVVDPDEYTKLKARFDADDLDPAFDSKWIEMPLQNPDGSMSAVRRTVAEVKQGYMRTADYSNKLAEVSQMRRDVLAARQGQELLMQHLSQPQTFIQAMHNLGRFEVFEAAAEIYATQERWPLEQLKRSNPQAYEQLVARRQVEKRLLQAENQSRMAAQQAQQAAQQAQPSPDAQTQQIGHQLSQMIPLAMQRAGIEQAKQSPQFKLIWDEPVAGTDKTQGERIFELHWGNLLPTLTGPLTTQFVTQVMQATRETVEGISRETFPVRSDPRLPPPSQGIAGRPAAPQQPGQNGRPPQRAKIQDMSKYLRGRT